MNLEYLTKSGDMIMTVNITLNLTSIIIRIMLDTKMKLNKILFCFTNTSLIIWEAFSSS